MSPGKPTLKSCQNCRIAKAKCIPSPDPIIKQCQRCIKYNKECFYEESRPRPKRGKQAHTRVAAVEKQLDDIYKSIVVDSQTAKPEQTTGLEPKVPTTTHRESNGDMPTPTPSWTSGIEVRASISNPGNPHKRRERDAIDKDILSEKEADDLLRSYRVNCHSFPFVYIKPETTLDRLRDDKPFLLLAILTTSCQKARSLQVLLEKELREVLASKVIIEGELSFDVLQGLLIYLSWYHHNFRPCRQQVYLLTQLCGSMAIDLELHKPPVSEPRFLVHPSKGCMATKVSTAAPAVDRLESMRTYIGVYCLTTSISIMLRKPNGMSWSPYLERCCNDLAEAAESVEDPFLIHYIQFLHICEDISSTFGYCSPEPELELGPSRIQSTVRAFITKIQDLEEKLPPETQNIPSLMSLVHTAPNLAYEIILHLDARAASPSSTISPDTWHTSTIRTEMFLSALESTIRCLDWFCTLSLSAFERLNLLDMSRISYHLLLFGRLTLSGIPGSEADMASQTRKLNTYFDIFLEKYQQISVLQGSLDEKKSVYWHLHEIFSASKDWMSSRIAERMRTGGHVDLATTAKVQPNFQMLSPLGVVDLDKGKSEELGQGFSVTALNGTHPHDHHHHEPPGNERPVYVGRTWEAALAALPSGLEGSMFF